MNKSLRYIVGTVLLIGTLLACRQYLLERNGAAHTSALLNEALFVKVFPESRNAFKSSLVLPTHIATTDVPALRSLYQLETGHVRNSRLALFAMVAFLGAAAWAIYGRQRSLKLRPIPIRST